MKKREPVSHIMTKDVFTVDVQDNLTEVQSLLTKKSIRHVPVVSGEKLVGILSKSDINRLTFGNVFEGQEGADEAVLGMLNIKQVMSNNPRTVDAETTIKEVAEIFSQEEFHALPVVENNAVAGIVTTTDVIQYLLEQY